MCRHLRNGASLPTALFCTNDIVAFGVLKALREIGSTAMSRLVQRIAAPHMPPVKTVIGGTLMERSSVKTLGPPVTIDPDDTSRQSCANSA